MTNKLSFFKKYCFHFSLSIIIVFLSFFSFVPYSDSATCTSVTISPADQNFTSGGSSEIIVVTGAEPGCSWTAISNDSWIKIIGTGGFGGAFNTGGTGSVNIADGVNFSVDPNSGAARIGTITVGDKTFTVNQEEQTGTTTTTTITTTTTTTSSTTTTTILAKQADLKALSVLATPSKVKAGSRVNIKATVKNIGKANASSFKVSFYVSTNKNRSIDVGDILFKEITIPLVKINNSKTVAFGYKVPKVTPKGTYYIKVNWDSGNSVSESNETNNIAVPKKIVIK